MVFDVVEHYVSLDLIEVTEECPWLKVKGNWLYHKEVFDNHLNEWLLQKLKECGIIRKKSSIDQELPLQKKLQEQFHRALRYLHIISSRINYLNDTIRSVEKNISLYIYS